MAKTETIEATKQKLITVLLARVKAGDDSPAKQTELLKRSGINTDYLSVSLNELAKEGVLVNPRRGEWQISKKYLEEKQR